MFGTIVAIWTLLLQCTHHQSINLTKIIEFDPPISYINVAGGRAITSAFSNSSNAWNISLLFLEDNTTASQSFAKQIVQPQINSPQQQSKVVYLCILNGSQIWKDQSPFQSPQQLNLSSSPTIQKLVFTQRPYYFYSQNKTVSLIDWWYLRMRSIEDPAFEQSIEYKAAIEDLTDFVVGENFIYSIVYKPGNGSGIESGIHMYKYNKSNTSQFTLFDDFNFTNKSAEVSVSPDEQHFAAYTEERVIYGHLNYNTTYRYQDSLGPISRIYEVVLCNDYTLILLQRSGISTCQMRVHKNEFNLTFVKLKEGVSCGSSAKIFCDPQGSFKFYTLNKLFSVQYLDEETQNNSSDTTDNSTVNNATVNQPNSTTNSTAANRTEDAIQPVQEDEPPIDETTQAAALFFSNEQVSSSMQTTASIVPIASLVAKGLLKFVNVGIDMFWMYSYHQRNYSRFLTVLTSQLDVMAELRMKPNFLNFFDEIKVKAIDSFNESNRNYRSLGNFQQKVPTDIYFLKTSFDVYTTNIVMTLITFGIMLIMKQISFWLKDKLGLFELLYDYCLINTRWWMLLIALIEGNLSYLAFYACLQMQVPFFTTFTDKFNIAVTLILFFVLIVQSLVFYPMLYALEEKLFSENMLDVEKFNLKGFLLIMTMNSISNFGRAVFHGMFINQNMAQLIGLVSTNIFVVAICIIVRREFRNVVLFLATMLVYLIGACFDIFLTLDVANSQKYQYESYITIVSLSFLAASFLKTVVIIACDMFELVRDFCRSNQVANDTVQEDINNDELPKLPKEYEPSLTKKHDSPIGHVIEIEPIPQIKNPTDDKDKKNKSPLKPKKKAEMNKKNLKNSEALMAVLTKDKRHGNSGAQHIQKRIKPKKYIPKPKKP